MPRIRECTVCQNEFMSYNGKEVCSEKCAIERKHRQDNQGNFRRKMKLSNQPVEKICPICGKTFETVRNKYCSINCSTIAKKTADKENMEEYYLRNRREVIAKVIERKKQNK